MEGMDKMKEYKLWLDIAKGYGMIFVIFGHLYHMTAKAIVYIFHMPLFYFLSGYTYNPKGTFKEFFFKKVKRFAIPYIVLGVLNSWVDLFCEGSLYGNNILKGAIDVLLNQRYLIMWFLTTLFVLEIAMYFVFKKKKDNKRLFIISMVIYVLARIYFYFNPNSRWIWNIDVCFTAQFFFILGKLLANLKILEKEENKRKLLKKMIICFSIMLLLGGINYKLSGGRIDIYANDYGLPIITELAALLGIVGTIKLAHITTNIRILQYIGKNSLTYMLIHPIIINILQAWIFPTYIKSLDNFGGAAITFLICIKGIKIIIEMKTKICNHLIKMKSVQ